MDADATQLDSCPTWEVVLPERHAAALGAKKPLATVTIGEEGASQRVMSVPVAVGRQLRKKENDPDFAPGSAAELIYEIGQLKRSCIHERLNGLIARRDYASAEAISKLMRDGYSRALATEAVERACEVGLIDDARFAAAFIRAKAQAGWGQRRISDELRRRGIVAEELEGWPDAYFETSEFDRAYALASRRSARQRSSQQSVVRYLASKGFSSDVAWRVARQIADELREEENSLAT